MTPKEPIKPIQDDFQITQQDFVHTRPAEPTDRPEIAKAANENTTPSLLSRAAKTLANITGGSSSLTGHTAAEPTLYADTEQPADQEKDPVMSGEDRMAAEWAAALAEASPVVEDNPDATSDPMQRKLELADEFRQIGDLEGARDLLEEVLGIDPEGKYGLRAREMLDQLKQDSDTAPNNAFAADTSSDELPMDTRSQEEIDNENDKIVSDQMFRIAEFPELRAVGEKLHSGDLSRTFTLLVPIKARSTNPELKEYVTTLLSKIRRVIRSANTLRGALQRYNEVSLSAEEIQNFEEHYAKPARISLTDLYTKNTDVYKRLRKEIDDIADQIKPKDIPVDQNATADSLGGNAIQPKLQTTTGLPGSINFLRPKTGRSKFLQKAMGFMSKSRETANKALDYINTGIVDDVNTAAQKVESGYTKLREELKRRLMDSAKYLTDLDIKNLDRLDKIHPKAKLIVGLGAAGISIFTGTALATGAWQAVSTAALSRRSYQKHMQKALGEFAYNQFVESKKDFFENTLLNNWIQEDINKGKDPNTIKYFSFDQWTSRNNRNKYEDWEKEKEVFVSKIKMSDFEADTSYKDKRYRAIELSLATGLALGVLMPSAIKEFIDSEAFDFIKDKINGYTPDAILDAVDNIKGGVGEAWDRAAEVLNPTPTPTLRVIPEEPASVASQVASGADNSASAAASQPAPAASQPVAPTSQAVSAPAHVAPTAPVNPTVVAAPTIDWEKFPISAGDNLETLMKDRLDILNRLSDKQKENVIYNFFNTSAGDTWRGENSITNIDRIFTGNTINLQSLNEAIANTKFTNSDKTIESLIARARNAFP